MDKVELRACFKNIPVGLAAGRGGWLRCSSVTDFSRICSLLAPRHPPHRARNPFPSLFLKHALTGGAAPGLAVSAVHLGIEPADLEWSWSHFFIFGVVVFLNICLLRENL